MYNTDLKTFFGVPRSKAVWTRAAEDHMKEVNRRYHPLSIEELSACLTTIQSNGEGRAECIEKVIDSMGPVIIRCALQFADSTNYMDYVQEGACVILDCVEKFDPGYNKHNTSTFMTYCIRSIFNTYGTLYTHYNSTATFSAHISNQALTNLKKYADTVFRTTGIPVTYDDLQEYCKLAKIPFSPSLLGSIYTSSLDVPRNNNGMSDDDESSMSSLMSNHDASLEPDAWVESYDNNALVESIRNVYKNYVNEKCSKKSGINKERMMRNLDILFDFYGVEGREPLNVYELGAKYHMDRERARQIVNEMVNTIKKMLADKQNKH